MNIKKVLINLGLATIIGTIIGIASLMPIKKANALDGNIKYIQSEVNANSYAEANAFYKFPGKIKGYTFMDFHKNGNGYFGKTSLERALWHGVGPKTQIVHGNEPFSQAGLGISAVVPYMPKKNICKG